MLDFDRFMPRRLKRFVAIVICLISGELLCCAEYLLVAPDSGLPVDALVGRWTMASGDELQVSFNKENRCVVLRGDGAESELDQDSYLKSLYLTHDGMAAVAHVETYKRTIGASYYSHLLIIYDKDIDNDDDSIIDVMRIEELRKADKRFRSVIVLGSIENFPLVDLYISSDELLTRPTPVVRSWQEWNLLDDRFVRRLDSEVAEKRLREFKIEALEGRDGEEK